MVCTVNYIESSGKIPSWPKTQITLSCLFSCCSCICHLWGFWHESVLFITACIFRLFTATEHLHIYRISSKIIYLWQTVHSSCSYIGAIPGPVRSYSRNMTQYYQLLNITTTNKSKMYEYIYSLKEPPNLTYKLVYVKVFSHITFMKTILEDIQNKKLMERSDSNTSCAESHQLGPHFTC